MTREEETIKYLKNLNEGFRKGALMYSLIGDNPDRDKMFATAIAALEFLDEVGRLYEKILLQRADILQEEIDFIHPHKKIPCTITIKESEDEE